MNEHNPPSYIPGGLVPYETIPGGGLVSHVTDATINTGQAYLVLIRKKPGERYPRTT